MEDNFNFQQDNNKKKNKGMTVLVIILVIIIIAMASYICYDKGILFGDSKVNNPNEETEKENKKEENKENNEKQEDVIKPLDLSKCLNSSNFSYANPKDSSSDNGLTMQINGDKKSITLSIDWKKFGPLSQASAWAPEVQTYQITGFNNEIKDTFVGGVGQDSTGITLFYLMSDGTVQFTPMFVRKTDTKGNMYFAMNYSSNSNFTTSATASGVYDVIKLYTADQYASNSIGGGVTTIGAKKDGSFYDLSNDVLKAQGR